MRFKLKLLPVAIAAAMAVSLSGCDKAPESETSSVNLSGVASKGIIKYGIVSAYPVINGIVQPLPIETAKTDEEGNYALSIPGYNGPLSITVSKADDGSSQVVCDVVAGCAVAGSTPVAFGADMPLTFTMESIVPKASAGSDIKVAITPFTTMAAKYAKKVVITEATAELANKKIANMLGVTDLIATQPVDLTSSAKIAAEMNPDSIKYAILSAAIAKVANEDAGGDIGSVISGFAQAYSDNDGELVGNDGADNTAVFSLVDITNAASAMATEVETQLSVDLGETTKGELTQLDTDTGALTEGNTTVTEVVAIASTDVDTAKAIVEEMRTWATSLKNLEADGELFGTEVDMAMQSGGDALEKPLIALGYSVEAMAEAYFRFKDAGETSFALSDLLAVTGDSDYFQPSYDEFGNLIPARTADTLSGTVIVSGATVSLTGATVDGSSVTLSLDMPASLSASSFTAGFTPLTAGYTISSTGADLHITSGAVSVSLDQTVDFMSDVQPAVEPNPTFASASLKGSLTQKNTVATNPVKFEGSIDATINFTQDDLGTSVNPNHIVMDGSFSNMETDGTTVRNVVTAKLDAYMRNSTTFKRPTQLVMGSTQTVGSYSFSTDGTVLTIVLDEQTVTVTYDASTNNVAVVNSYNYGYSNQNNYTVTEASLLEWLNAGSVNRLNLYSTYVENVGQITVSTPTWALADGTLTGSLDWPEEIEEDATHWRDIDGILTLTADFANVSDVEVVVSANRTAQQAGTGSATFKYDGFMVELKATIDAVNKNDTQVSASILNLTSNNKLVIYPDLESEGFFGTVSVNNNVVGTITTGLTGVSTEALIINYVNGEFQSVNF